MYEIYYHDITKEFLAHLRIEGMHLDEHLCLGLLTDYFTIHLEFLEDGATLGFMVTNLAQSQLFDTYNMISKRVKETKHDFLNIGIAIYKERNVAINTYIPNITLNATELINFYEYVNNEILVSF